MGILERVESKLDQLIALILAPEGVDLESINEAFAEAADAPKAPINVPHMEVPKPPVTSVGQFDGVDKEGVVWDARIHSKAAVPISASTGKWKKRKGLAEGLYESVMAELLAVTPISKVTGPFFWQDSLTGVSGTAENRQDMDQLLTVQSTVEITKAQFDALLNTQTTAPTAPKAPTAPTAPKAPSAEGVNPVKAEVIGLIKELTDTYECEANDINGLMVEVTNFDTLAKATEEGLEAFKSRLVDWENSLIDATEADTEMRVIADANGLMPDLNAALEGILEPHDANMLGLVHYSAIAGVCEQYKAYLASWQGL
jgi:hypothetical protein